VKGHLEAAMKSAHGSEELHRAGGQVTALCPVGSGGGNAEVAIVDSELTCHPWGRTTYTLGSFEDNTRGEEVVLDPVAQPGSAASSVTRSPF